MDLEGIVKEKIKLQEENKKLKQEIRDLKIHLSFSNGEIDKLNDKLLKISEISGRRKITFLNRVKGKFRRRSFEGMGRW